MDLEIPFGDTPGVRKEREPVMQHEPVEMMARSQIEVIAQAIALITRAVTNCIELYAISRMANVLEGHRRTAI